MFAKAKYSEIYDLSTQSGTATILKFHAPQSLLPQMYLRGFFIQFKKYRYVGSKITLVPAATLPADPLQVSYGAGEPTIDPREMVNPILHKPYHGEALADDINAMGIDYLGSFKKTTDTGTPHLNMESYYYATLQDPSWKKSHIQRGFSAWGKPLVRPVASNFQISNDGTDTGSYIGSPPTSGWSADPDNPDASVSLGLPFPQIGKTTDGEALARSCLAGPMDPELSGDNMSDSIAHNEFSMFTSGFKPLGWMDTTTRLKTSIEDAIPNPQVDTALNYTSATTGLHQADSSEYINRLPMIFEYIAMLPPSYKQEFYFRMIITHYFNFKDFRGASMPLDGARELLVQWSPLTVNAPAEKLMSYEDAVRTPSVDVEGGSIELTSAGVSS